MAFRIDLTIKNNITVYLVVLRNIMTFCFESINLNKMVTDYAALEMRDAFADLAEFINMTQECAANLGTGSVHVKRQHIVAEETLTPHYHVAFDQDVTPELLEEFFEIFLNIELKERGRAAGDLLITEQEMASVSNTFKEFYKDYSKSDNQRHFLADKALTLPEKESLCAYLIEKKAPYINVNDAKELLADDLLTKTPELEDLINELDTKISGSRLIALHGLFPFSDKESGYEPDYESNDELEYYQDDSPVVQDRKRFKFP